MELAEPIIRTSLAGVVTTTGLLIAVFVLTVPSSNALRTLVDTLPASRAAGAWGQMLPTIDVTLGFSLVLSLPALTVTQTLSGGRTGVLGLMVVLVCVVTTLALTLGLLTLFSWALAASTRLNSSYANAIAAATVIGLLLSSGSMDTLTRDLSSPPAGIVGHWALHRSFALLLTEDGRPFGILLAAGRVVAALLISGCASVLRPRARRGTFPALFRGWRPSAGPTAASLWFAIISAVRTPQFVTVTAGTFALLAAVLALSADPTAAPLIDSLAQSTPVVPFLLGIYGVGRGLRTRWVEAYVAPHTHRWIFTVALGNLVVSLAVGVVASAVLVLCSLLPAASLPLLAGRMLLAWALAMLAGALVPYSVEQPVSATAGAFLVAVLFLGGSLGVGLVASSMGAAAATVATVIAGAATFAVFWRVCLRHEMRVAVV